MSTESFELLVPSVLQKSDSQAEGRRGALMAASKDSMLSVIKSPVQNWENRKNKSFLPFCPSLDILR